MLSVLLFILLSVLVAAAVAQYAEYRNWSLLRLWVVLMSAEVLLAVLW